MRPASERPDARALRQVLLEETDPDPGLTERVLAGYRRAARRRTPWVLSGAAVILAAAIVITLMLVRLQGQRHAAPASTPPARPSSSLPPAVSARGLHDVVFTGPDSAWALQPAGGGDPLGPGILTTTSDGGAHWMRRADLPSSLGALHADPDGSGLVAVRDLRRAGDEAGALVILGTSDGGATWQPRQPPPGAAVAVDWIKDGHEAWVATWENPSTPGGRLTRWRLYRTADGARTWQLTATFDVQQAFGPDTVQGGMAFADATHGVFVPLVAGGSRIDPAPLAVRVTSDGGAHWQAAAVPSPPGVQWTTAGATVSRPSVAPGGRLVVILATRGSSGGQGRPPASPAQQSAYLSISDDGGLHWSQPRPLPPGGVEGQLDVNVGGLWRWVSNGTIWATTDEGAGWARVQALPAGQPPTVVRFRDADHGWTITGSLAPRTDNLLLATADGGRTWTPVLPPDPILPTVPCGGRSTVAGRFHLSIVSAGRAQPAPPAGLGQTAACRYRLHALDGSGTIAIEKGPGDGDRTYRLGDLLDVWGLPDAISASQFRSGVDPPVTVAVNGRSATGDPRDVPLRDGDDVVIQVGTGQAGGTG